MKELGTLEPVPGIPPTSKQIDKIITLVKNKGAVFLFQDVYHNQKASKFVAKRCKIKMVILPHDVGSVSAANDIFSLFDEIVRRLTE
jgi:zinc/manganese transport system substrate-binding protein